MYGRSKAKTHEEYIAAADESHRPGAEIGKSCVRFKRLSDLDENSLRELICETAEGELGA